MKLWLVPNLGTLVLIVAGCGAHSLQRPQTDAAQAGNDWRTYQGDPGATHYSPLAQINTRNVSRLEQAWTYDGGDAFTSGPSQSEMPSNPLVIGGRVLFVSPKGRLICLDAGTGREKWAFDPRANDSVAIPQRLRGVTYWTDGLEERVLFTFRQELLAVDMASGALISSFGKNGRVDLRDGLGRDPRLLFVTNVTPGVVYRDLLILGSTGNAPGHVRAYDVRTGEIRWTFHTIPYPGELGYETWPKDAWQRSFGANVWAGLTLDVKRGMIFLPVASGGMAVKDFYGADRLGDNLFANSLVALDAATGARRWHFQTVRHDLWDRDLPAQPTLVTVRRNGVEIPAIAQVTKSGYVFVLDRRTGESLFPLEERSVLPSDMPGEIAAEKQIIPKAPEPFARQHLTAELLTRRTPEAHAAVTSAFAQYRSRGPFDPPSLQGTIVLPGFDGGAEWGGAAYDPQTGLLYVNANEMAWIAKLKPRPQAANGSGGRALYVRNCSGCHGEDLRGSPPDFPSLGDVRFRLQESEIRAQIQNGGGRMPGFGHLGAEVVESMVQYLATGIDDTPQSPTSAGSHRDANSDVGGEAFVFEGYTRFLDPDGYPAVSPPWGTLSAIDVSTGRYAWKIPFGEYPELAAKGLRNTGSENYGGAVVTAGGLLFIGATVYDKKFHAYDKRTGKLLWETELPAAGIATPSTYMVDGRQFVVIAAGGGKDGRSLSGGSIIAFALPNGARAASRSAATNTRYR